MSMMDKYILVDKKAVPEPDVFRWARWFESANRVVKSSEIHAICAGHKIGDVNISTVFLGIDHGRGSGRRKLFETMVFGGPMDGEQDRCATWEQAEKMHERMRKKVIKIIENL
jgi:hypothetical protein